MLDEEVRGPLNMVKIGALSLPVILKIGWVYLKYKRKVNKRQKIIKKTLKKEGVEDWMVEELCDEMKPISIRDMLSSSGLSSSDIPFIVENEFL